MAVNPIGRHIGWNLALGGLLFGVAACCNVARADYIDAAAAQYGVNAGVLRAIAYHESSLNPNAQHRNRNGSVDVGLMQVNSVHFAWLERQHIRPDMLWNPSVNARVGAALLRRQIDRYGSVWRAVGAYHSMNPNTGGAYSRVIHNVYVNRRWERDRRPTRDSVQARSTLVETIAIE
ncbi:lytic transglycosylase domain-containing protein [Pandoraea pulmonicola]|uniref:Invasion protein IagB n=1 Tax=Pandoraea pulmonicola TaxID=93221 RepID=A0AAJ5D3A4_PANPU|nr:lytic transglycosylase domain-containing protein [Pandoraea pulmonicola]SUD95618.1 invasion protein IagB [Pandoraea pulmonicola]